MDLKEVREGHKKGETGQDGGERAALILLSLEPVMRAGVPGSAPAAHHRPKTQ